MSVYDQKVILWPFEITTADRTIVFEDTLSNPTSQIFIVSTYLTSGDGGVVAPLDVVARLNTMMVLAVTALGLASTYVATRDADGKCSIVRTAGINILIIRWDLSTFDRTILGFDGVATTTLGSTAVSGPFLMDFQWMPGKPEVHSDPDIPRLIASEDLSIEGRPSRVVHSPGVFFRREIIWERLWAARMIQARADDPAFADPADLPVGDDATWTTLWLYLNGPVGPFNDNRVYVLQTSIAPTTADRTGPYEVILGESEPDILGVETSSYVQSLAAEQFDASLMFWKATI